mgnify:FL=1
MKSKRADPSHLNINSIYTSIEKTINQPKKSIFRPKPSNPSSEDGFQPVYLQLFTIYPIQPNIFSLVTI